MRVEEGWSSLNLAFFVNRGFLPSHRDKGKVTAEAAAPPQCKTGQTVLQSWGMSSWLKNWNFWPCFHSHFVDVHIQTAPREEPVRYHPGRLGACTDGRKCVGRLGVTALTCALPPGEDTAVALCSPTLGTRRHTVCHIQPLYSAFSNGVGTLGEVIPSPKNQCSGWLSTWRLPQHFSKIQRGLGQKFHSGGWTTCDPAVLLQGLQALMYFCERRNKKLMKKKNSHLCCNIQNSQEPFS